MSIAKATVPMPLPRLCVVMMMFLLSLIAQLPVGAQEKDAQDAAEALRKVFYAKCSPGKDGSPIDAADCESVVTKIEEIVQSNPEAIEPRQLLMFGYLVLSTARRNEQGEFVRDEGLRERALEEARAVLALAPDNASALLFIANTTRDDAERKQVFARFRALDPDRPEWLMADYHDLVKQGRAREGVDKFIEYIRMTDQEETNDILGYLAGAADLVKRGHKAQALRIYDAIINLSRLRKTYSGWRWKDRRGTLCGFVLADFLHRYSEFPEFVERVKRFRLFCEPKEHLQRGEAAFHSGDLEVAIEELDWQLEENPYPPMTYVYLAEAYGRLGQMDEASEVVRKFFTLEKDVIFRCIYHDRMLRENFQQFAPDLIREVGEECRQWKAAGANP